MDVAIEGPAPGGARSEVAICGPGDSKCGYCHSGSRTGRSSFGIVAERLTPVDYQVLIDRGWRRSGTYVYKPDNRRSCCPNWTIRLPVEEFRPTKKHRKIRNRFREYIQHGPRTRQPSDDASMQVVNEPVDSDAIQFESYLRCAVQDAAARLFDARDVAFTFKKSATLQCNVAFAIASQLRRSTGSSTTPADVAEKVAMDLTSMQLRDVVSVAADANGFVLFTLPAERAAAVAASRRQRHAADRQKRAAQQAPAASPPYVRYTTTVVGSRFREEAFLVYQRYQVAVHGDPIARVTREQYKNFLCDTPLVETASSAPSIQYGSFHVEYRFDGRLIGVSVVDILPRCVSSVYFFYDPDLAALSLGVYSALHEISMATEAHASLRDLKFYYLGYYIHTCPKMRYKAQFPPTQVLCPERYTWHSLEQCLPALDTSAYVVFSDVSTQACDDDWSASAAIRAAATTTTVDGIEFDIRGHRLRFGDLKPVSRGKLLDILQSYFDLVGPFLAATLVVVNIFA
ncbi:unnamed protein product (mitochondrion) [Plasmodiophora brassicae]|uniref:Arginyl-tRNA--protein transferase 1 n=1 Tax=Plasmodiophora brassicae TaxID=37360 RepID=A0A3P3Y4Z9_PLABS|nr:unnamed protein product [Plasmodiophora brassicae]